jgi:hypothetical protein
VSDDTAPDTSPTGEPAICAAARSLIGLTEDDAAYAAIVDPVGPYAEEVRVAHSVSSCMLVAAWLLGWREQFVADTIQNTLRSLWGGSTGRVPDVDDFCGPGAQIWWRASASSPEHVDAAVLAVQRSSLVKVMLTVVAGGQRNAAGKRCIAQLTREVYWDGRAWTDATNGRCVLGVHDP